MLTTAQLKRRFFVFGFAFALIPGTIGFILLTPAPAIFQTRSQQIDWENDALPLRSSYKFSKRHFKTFNPAGSRTLDTMSGLRFTAGQFDTLINHNGKKPQYIMLYFGRNKSDVTSGRIFSRKHPSYTVVTVAVDSSGTLKKGMVYDKADPCPPNCPDDDELELPL